MFTEIVVPGPVLDRFSLTQNKQLRTVRLSTWEESYEMESDVFLCINACLQSVVSPYVTRLDLVIVYLDLTTISDLELRRNIVGIDTTLSGSSWSNLTELNLEIAFGEEMPSLVRTDLAKACLGHGSGILR